MKTSTAPLNNSKREPIVSAEKVAAVRAFGVLDPLAQNPDDLAACFLGRKHRFLVWALSRSLRVGRWLMEKKSPGTYWYLQARTKHIDRSMVLGLEEGMEQVVILGAGYDTRPYRFKDRLENVRVFEVDIAPTQERKLQHLEALYEKRPPHVTFVPTDFNRDCLSNVLDASGFDPSKRTLFIWEGVIYYLPEESVRSVLTTVRDHSAAGSRIVFDYILSDGLAGDEKLYGAKEAMKLWREMGEPGLFGFDDAKHALSFLTDLGFGVLSDIDSREMESRYGISNDEHPVGRIIECLRFLDAEVMD